MTQGFITIATGKELYFRIAANLLRSYRLRAAHPKPFAILCDRENRYTELFDDVILMKDPLRSYVDKVRLPEFVPYDETIFIDADSLIYRDPDFFWKVFEGGPAFSAFGSNYGTDERHAWFRIEDTGEFRDRVQYIPDFIGGVYYLRRSEELDRFGETARYIRDHYYDYRFRQFENPSDEAIYSLAMAVHGFRTAGDRSPDVCFIPHTETVDLDFLTGKVEYTNIYKKEKGLITDSCMVHWGTGNTKKHRYLLEEYKLNEMDKKRKPGLFRLSMVSLWIKTRLGVYGAYRRTAGFCWRLLHSREKGN